MQKELLPKVEQFAKQNKRRSIWRKFVRAMACVVVFCTTYALILPAITLEREKCTLEEHTHSDSCYRKVTSREQRSLLCSYEILGIHTHTEQCLDAEQNLICGVADFVLHEHDASCFNENDTLICLLPEIKEHQHSEGCYQMPQVEEHSHTDACYSVQRGALLCQMEEYEGHAHTAECMIRGDLICQLEESEGHVHGDSCVQEESPCELPETEGHIHGDDCYALVPDCGQEETQGHFHEDACYEQISELICQPVETEAAEPVQICEKEEIELHTHDEKNCYETYLDENEEEQTRLICQRTVVEEHVHGDSCFVTESVPMEDVDTITCGLEESEEHTHSDRCYGTWELICGKEEHTHTEECMLVDEEEPVGNGEDSSGPVGYVYYGNQRVMFMAPRSDGEITYYLNIEDLITRIQIVNSSGDPVYDSDNAAIDTGTVRLGEKCKIILNGQKNSDSTL